MSHAGPPIEALQTISQKSLAFLSFLLMCAGAGVSAANQIRLLHLLMLGFIGDHEYQSHLGDAQLDLFDDQPGLSVVYDDPDLLDIAPFSLAKFSSTGRQYELKDASIAIVANEDRGMATAWDYDIVLIMLTRLVAATRGYRAGANKASQPALPPKTFSSSATEILKSRRRALGGKQYSDLEPALERLRSTEVRITRRGMGRALREDRQSSSLIGPYRVVSRHPGGTIDEFEMDFPDWAYERALRSPEGAFSRLSSAYFQLVRPTERFLYRLARKTSHGRATSYSISDLYMRSGGITPPHKFRSAVAGIVASYGPDNPFPEYDLRFRADGGHSVLEIRRRLSIGRF